MKYIYDSFGIKRKIKDVAAVERLFSLKEKSGSNPWPVIEQCIKIWESSEPNTWDSYLYHLESTRETRKDQKFASVHDKKNDGFLRYTLDIPEKVLFMIRCVYDADELPMNKEFFQSFAQRFPKFKIAEKL